MISEDLMSNICFFSKVDKCITLQNNFKVTIFVDSFFVQLVSHRQRFCIYFAFVIDVVLVFVDFAFKNVLWFQ